jgi:hypothetical protein
MTASEIATVVPHDKALHLIAGSLSALAGLALGHVLQWSPLLAAAAMCALAAVCREVVNYQAGGRFDLRDIVWTLCGSGTVLAAAWVGA